MAFFRTPEVCLWNAFSQTDQEDTKINALQIQRYDHHFHKHQFYQYGFKYPCHPHRQRTTELTGDQRVLRSQSPLKAGRVHLGRRGK